MLYLRYTLSFLLLSVASASYLPMAQAQTVTTPVISIGLVPGRPPNLDSPASSDMFITERLALPLAYTSDDDSASLVIDAHFFSAYAFNAGGTATSINQTGRSIGVLFDACLLVDGQEVDYDPSHPYYERAVNVRRTIVGFNTEPSFNFGTSCGDSRAATGTVVALLNGDVALLSQGNGNQNTESRVFYRIGSGNTIERTVDLIGQLSIRIRIRQIAYIDEDGTSDAGVIMDDTPAPPSSEVTILEDRREIIINLNDVTTLPPLGFDFVSVSDGVDGRYPLRTVRGNFVGSQLQYPDILAGLNNANMHTATHALPEGAIIQFVPRFEDAGGNTFYIVGTPDQAIEIPLQFDAGANPARFGGAFVALRSTDTTDIREVLERGLNAQVRDNRCRLLNRRSGQANDINDTVDYCLQQRGIASENLRLAGLDFPQPAIINTTGTSTVLLPPDGDGIVQLALRFAPTSGTNSITLITGRHGTNNPFNHLLMGLVIAAPKMPDDLSGPKNAVVSGVVPVREANTDLTLEPDEHFSMRWSSTNQVIPTTTASQRNFVIRGHSSQTVLFHSERFARIQEFGLSPSDIYASDYLADGLRYFPYFEFTGALQQVRNISAVARESESVANAFTLMLVADAPNIVLFDGLDRFRNTNQDRLNQPLYYTDTIERTFEFIFDDTLFDFSDRNSVSSLTRTVRVRATLPATDTPTELLLHFQMTGEEDLNAINERFQLGLIGIVEVTPSLSSALSEADRTLISTQTISIDLVVEDDDPPPQIGLSYRLFDLAEDPYNNTGGALTEDTLSGYRVQGGGAIVNVARDTNPDELNIATMPRFPSNLSRYRFGIDVPEHDLSLPVPEGLGTIVGRGRYLARLDDEVLDLTPHFELYAVFVTPKPRADSAFSFVNNDGIAESPTPEQYSEFSAFAGLVHPHNLGSGASDIDSIVDVGTREALNNTSANSTIPSISALLPQDAQNIMLFARISHNPAELDMAAVLNAISTQCEAVLDERGLTASPGTVAELTASNFTTDDDFSGNFLVSINDHRHAAGSADKLDQPFSILNIAGADMDARTTINQYGFRENIATMNVALLCASDPSLSPDLTDNLNADGTMGPEYCATHMAGTGARSYCQVGQFDLNYTDYLPELYAAPAAAFDRYLHRSHTGALYEADAATDIAFGFEAGTATDCQGDSPAQRCNRASWEIRSAPRIHVRFYGAQSRVTEFGARDRLEYKPKVNTLTDNTRLQWAISVVPENTPPIDTDESALNLVRVLSTDGRQMTFNNTGRGSMDISAGLADSLALLTSVLPEGSDPTKLAFATQIIENNQYRNCALLSDLGAAIAPCVDENASQVLRVEPAILARVYDSDNNPALVRHPIATAGVSTATITIEDPDVYAVLETSAGDGTLDEASPGENGRFVDYSVRFGGTSNQIADRVDLALIFYADTDSTLQLHAETSNTTAIEFFTDVDNPAKADSDIVVQARGEILPYGGLWSTATINAGTQNGNPLTLLTFGDAQGVIRAVADPITLNDPATGIDDLYAPNRRVLLALRFPAIAPSTEPQLLARVYANSDEANTNDGTRELLVTLGVLSASTSPAGALGNSLDYLQAPDPNGGSDVAVRTAGHLEALPARYVDNYEDLAMQGLSAPVTQNLRLLDVDVAAPSISVSVAPGGMSITAEQIQASHQMRLNHLFSTYTNSAGMQVVPPNNTRALLRLDLSIPAGARLSANNQIDIDFMGSASSDSGSSQIDGNTQNGFDAPPVYVLFGGNAGQAFGSGNCAGLDISATFDPVIFGGPADRTEDGAAFFDISIGVSDITPDDDFYGDQAFVYTPRVVCSDNPLFDASVDNRALAGNVCEQGTTETTARSRTDATPIDTCALENAPRIDVVETARPDILLSIVTTEMDETASVTDILADASATIHDLSTNLVVTIPEPDAVRPAIGREAIPANSMALIARLSDDAVNLSSSTIVLNRLTDQLDQLPSQFTFVPSPQFTATGGIPDGANGVVIGTILISEDELMEGDTDYSLLMAGATDYIVARRASTIRAAIHTQLPMVNNPITGTPEQQAADYVFRMALDLAGGPPPSPVVDQVQNQVLPTMRVVDADDYFHYIVEGPEVTTSSNAVRNRIIEADMPVVNLRIGLGGAQIAWGGNNPTAILSDTIIRNAPIQTLTEAQFDMAEFLDTPAPAFTTSSLFVNVLSTADFEGGFQDVVLEIPSEAVNIVLEGDANVAAYRSDQPWWQLRFQSDDFLEGSGGEYLEIALALREASPTNPAMPRALRREGAATHLRYEIIDPDVGAIELGMIAQPTVIVSEQERYPLPIISEYLLSDVMSAPNNTPHATVSVLTLPGLPAPPGGIVTQIDVYGHLASRDGNLVLTQNALLADADIPEAQTGYAADVSGVPVRRFYVQLDAGNQMSACVAGSGITADQVITQIPIVNANGRFELPISLGARRPDNTHSSTGYGGTRVLRLHASVLCSDDPNYTAGTSAMHAWQDPTNSNSTITDTRGIPVLLRDRADEFTLSYFVATTDSLPQAGFTPSTQLGLHEADVVRPLPNTFAQLHIHAALTSTSVNFGEVPIIPISELSAPIPISSLRTITTGICVGGEDCIPTPDADTTDYYLGSIRAGEDADDVWELNSQLQLIGANTAHESAGTDFASAWLSPNPAIVSDPLQDPSLTARNALLVPSAPSALFDNRVFNAPARIVSSIPAQSITLQDAQSYIAISAGTPTFVDDLDHNNFRTVNLRLYLSFPPMGTLSAPTDSLPTSRTIQLGFVFKTPANRPQFTVADTCFSGSVAGGANFGLFACDESDISYTQSLGFDVGDSQTTSTIGIDNGEYFVVTVDQSNENSMASASEQQTVDLRMALDTQSMGAADLMSGIMQVHLVAPPPEGSSYYIYPEDDPIAPSAVNIMLQPPEPIIPCVEFDSATTSEFSKSDYTQPYDRDCLLVQNQSTHTFSVSATSSGTQNSVAFLVPSGSGDTDLSPIRDTVGAFYRAHYYSPDEGVACEVPPESGPLAADSLYVSGRHVGSTMFESNTDYLSDASFVVDTTATAPEGVNYCVILEANAGSSTSALSIGLNVYTEPASVDLTEILPISIGLVPGIPPNLRPGQDYTRNNIGVMPITERLALPLEYTVDDTSAGLDISALHFSAYVFNADGTTTSINQTGRELGVLIELCLLVDGNEVDYDPSHPYYDGMFQMFKSFVGFPREGNIEFGTSCDDERSLPSETEIPNGGAAWESDSNANGEEAGSTFLLIPLNISRTVDLIGDLSVRIRIERITYITDVDGPDGHSFSDDGPPEDEVSILEARREIIINLNDATQLPPLGFNFVSVADGADARYPFFGSQFSLLEQLNYPDILANLNNTAMHTAEHAVPEGAIIQFRPNFEGSDTYYVVGTPDQAIEIPLQFEAGANPARFGGAFVALKGSANTEIGLDARVRDNRCRLTTPRDANEDREAVNTINIAHTVDYCLQQRGVASENLRLTSANPAEPAIINTTGTSTVLMLPDGDGIVQLALRIAPISSRTSVTLINGMHDNNPFQHLLMGLVIAAPNMPSDVGGDDVSAVVPAREANIDLTLEPDEHFSMRWSTTNPDIRLSDASRRNFVIRGHSSQTVLFHSERFARINDFGLSASDIYHSGYLANALRYFPYFELEPGTNPNSLVAVRESASMASDTFSLRLVADTPQIALNGNRNGANDDRMVRQSLYYTDTISREFELTFELLPGFRAAGITTNTISTLTRSVRAEATLPAAASPTELLLQVELMGEQDLNAINERFTLRLSGLVEVTPSLSSALSEAERTLTSTEAVSIRLRVEDDDPPPQISLSYRLFDLDEDPYNNTGGMLTEDTLNNYRVQGSVAIVPVARDTTNQNFLDTTAMPRFPANISRYRFGMDVPEHDLSLSTPPAPGTIVGRGTYLADFNTETIDLAPHFELYAVFLEPEANLIDYVGTGEFGADPLSTRSPATREAYRFAGLVHPHNLDTSSNPIEGAPVGTRESIQSNSQIPAKIRNTLPSGTQNLLLFARLSHNPDDLDIDDVYTYINQNCHDVLSDDSSNGLANDSRFLVSINDHRHAAGSPNKLDQPFSILNILGSRSDDDEALYQYGYHNNIGTMKVALLCASDPSLSPDPMDNTNADGSPGPEYCATRMEGTGSRTYCEVGSFTLAYTDYLPELYNPDLILSGIETVRYIARSHTAPLYEADMPTGIALGFEAGNPADCETGRGLGPRCNQLTWYIEGDDSYNVGFYGNHSRTELLRYVPRVNTPGDNTRLQWAISVVTTPTAGDLSVSQLVRTSTVLPRQTALNNPGRGSTDIPAGLVDSLILLTPIVPVDAGSRGEFHKLAFNMRITDNQRYRYCALLSKSADAIQDCVGANAAQQLRLEPAVLARVYDSNDNPVLVRHPIATRSVSTATITIADPDLYAVLETSAGNDTVDEASPGEDGRFVEYSVRFGGTSDQMTDLVDLALIFHADTNISLQLHAETSNTTAIEFFTGVDNPAKADSAIVVQARSEILPYGGLWSDPTLEAGTLNENPLALNIFTNAAGNFENTPVSARLNNPSLPIEDLYVNHKVLLALRFPRIAPSTESQLLVRVYATPDETGTIDGARSLNVQLGILSASDAPADVLGSTLEYLRVPDPDGGSEVPVRTAGPGNPLAFDYLGNYRNLQGLSMPVTRQLALLDGDAVGISVVSTPNSNFNILAEQNTISAQHQIQLNGLLSPYISAGTRVTPTAANTHVLLRLDFFFNPDVMPLSPNNRIAVRVVDSDDSNDNTDTGGVGSVGVNTLNGFAANPVYVLLGGDHTGSIPNFASGNCAGIDISTLSPLQVGSTTDRTQDDGASFTLEIFANDNAPDADFYGDQSLVYIPNVVCSDHPLFDPSADNRALTGHVCDQGTFDTTARSRDDATTIDVCQLPESPMIGVVETARPDILLSIVTTEMDETASVTDILANASATHDFVSELVLSAPEPDGARPAIERAAIPANGMALIARLSDDAVNRSRSTIMLNRLSDQLDQFASQLTFAQSPDFSSAGGIPDGENGIVIGTIMPLEDELIEGVIDYPLLMAGATDYIVARRTSSIRAEINAQLPMVDNPITGTQEQQAADYEFRLALNLSGTSAQTQVQNQILPTLRVVDADDYFHYLVGGATELVSNAARRTLREANTTDDIGFIRVGLGGTQIAWGGNNPTNVLSDAITQSATIQTLTDEQFDRAEFLDPSTPTFTARSTFVNADSTVELEGEFQDVMLEYQGGRVTFVSGISPSIRGTTSDLWILRTVPDFFAEGDEYLEIAFAFREASPANPAMPRMLRRLGPATHLRYEIIDAAMGDTELVMEARATAVAARRADYQLPIISEYLASDVVSANNNTAHATVSVLTLPGVPQPPGGIVAQIDVYGHLASRDGDLVLAGRAPVADAEIPESNLGYAANVASVPVRRFYVQVGITGSPVPTCVAGSEIRADQVIAQPHLTGAHGRFELPISLGARRPDNVHPSTRYGGTRVLRVHASILCSDDPNYITGTPASHQWQDPDVLNTTNTDTRGIPVLLRDRADEFTLSYFAAATDSLPQASFTPSTQLGLYEEDVVRPLPNTFAQLHIHAALTPTSAEFGQAPIVPVSELSVPIPISDFQAISTGICDGSEDCIPTPDTDTTDYYLGSIRAGIDANNTWESNSQLQLMGANTAHETAGTDFASAWLSPNPAIVADPLTDPDVMTARNALLVPSMPSALFNNRVFNAPALIVSSIAPQSILLQDAQSFISISATTPTTPGFTAIDGRQGDEDRGIEFQIHFGGMPTQPVEEITGLPGSFTRLQLGFVFRFDSGISGADPSRPDFRVSNTAGAEFRLETGSDPRASDILTLTESLGFNPGDTNTTSTLTLSGANTYYFEVTLAIDSASPGLTTEQRQRVLLRLFVDDDAGDFRIRLGTVQAHLVESEANFYIYPEDDPIAPSAVNFMLDLSDTPLVSCAAGVTLVSPFDGFTQPYPRDCLSAQSTSAYAFSVETGGLDFVFTVDGGLVFQSVSWSGRLIRVHYYSPDDGVACAPTPISGPLGADSPYVSGRYAGHTIFLNEDSSNMAGTREGNIVYVGASDSLGDLTLEVDTRATGPAGATYCAVLEVNLGGANAYTTPERVNLPRYSMDDDNNNGLPDDLEIAGGATGASQALLYGRDYCRRAGSSYNSQLGALNDCDNDGVPDLAELQYGPPEDNSDYTLSRVMCIAQGYYTRFPRGNVGNLLCTNPAGNQLAASQTIAAIEGDWLLAIGGNDYAGVALEVDSVGPPTTFRADNGLLPSNSYWFTDPDQMQVVEVYLAPTMRFRAPTSVLSRPDGQIAVLGSLVISGYYPMSAQLLGTVPESVGADIALEFEAHLSGDVSVDTLNTQIRFEPHSSFTRTLGTYRDHTPGFTRSFANPINSFFSRLRQVVTSNTLMSSATATVNGYTVYFDRPNHPLHGATLRDQRRAGEYYEIDTSDVMNGGTLFPEEAINPLPETLQLLNAPTTASITTALGFNPAASTLDFILREHQILTQNAGVLYLGPHPNISTPTGVSTADAMTLQEALRAQVDLSAQYIDNTIWRNFTFTNTSETWSLLPLGDESAEEIVLHEAVRTSDENPYMLPDVATLCDMLPTCTSKDGGVDYARLLFRQRDLDTTDSVRITFFAQLWLQLGGDPAQLFDDTDEDGVPEMDGDIEGALSLPFSVFGRHGHIVVEQQQVALQLGYRARTQYQTDHTFARGANIGSGDTLDLDFHLSCVDHAGQPGGLLYEADFDAPVTSYDLLRDISGELIGTAPTISDPRDDLYYAGCLGHEVPVLIRMPESMVVATNINIPNRVAGFDVKSYSFSGGLPDGSCPQANAQSIWWQPDGMAPRFETERCIRLVLEGDPAMAGLPLMSDDSEPLRVGFINFGGTGGGGGPGGGGGGTSGGVRIGIGQDGGSGGGAFGIMQLLLLGLLALNALRARRRRHLYRVSTASA